MNPRQRLQVKYSIERLTTEYEAGLVSVQAAALLQQIKWELTLGRLAYAAQQMAAASERLGRSLDRLADQLDEWGRHLAE
ncbi:MAG: hypothetical protein U0559_03720 [Anaerolineae bacterium]